MLVLHKGKTKLEQFRLKEINSKYISKKGTNKERAVGINTWVHRLKQARNYVWGGIHAKVATKSVILTFVGGWDF